LIDVCVTISHVEIHEIIILDLETKSVKAQAALLRLKDMVYLAAEGMNYIEIMSSETGSSAIKPLLESSEQLTLDVLEESNPTPLMYSGILGHENRGYGA
jgi:hypothetical protein